MTEPSVRSPSTQLIALSVPRCYVRLRARSRCSEVGVPPANGVPPMRPRCTKASAVGFTLATFAALIVVTFGSSTSNAEPVDVSTTAQKQAPSSGPQTLGQPEVGVDGASAAAERVRKYAETQHIATFAGVWTQNNGNNLRINLTSTDASIQNLLVQISALPAEQISFAVVPLNAEQLNQLFQKTSAQWDALSKFVTVREIMQDDAAGDVYVRTVDASSEQLAAVSALVGSNVRVLNDSSKEAEAHPAGRQDDTSPFYGGDFIQNESNGIFCSSGIPVKAPNGGDYMVTAGHCGSIGQIVDVGTPYYNGTGSGPRQQMGKISNDVNSNGTIDAALIFAPVAGVTWDGYTKTYSSYYNSGAAGYNYGDSVCHSGAYEGKICGFTSLTRGCADYGTGQRCNVVRAESSNNQAVGVGDSGGPVLKYYPDPNGGLALQRPTGVVVGVVGPIGNYCVNWSGSGQWPHRFCGNVMYYQDWQSIASQWGVTVKIGF